MRAYLSSLIERMSTANKSANSADSVSWHARREAEELVDLTFVTEIVEFLNSDPGKEQRQAAYFIVDKIGKNLQNPDCASKLLSFVPKEKDKYALASLLDGLADIPKPSDMDLMPIFQLLKDKRWLVRHSAIQALKNTNSPEVEKRLLEVLTTSTDHNDLIYCHATLNRVGTLNAISALQEGLKSRKRDVKQSAQAAIDAILSRSSAQRGAPAVAPKATRP